MWLTTDDDLIPTLPPAHTALFRAAARSLSDDIGWIADDAFDPIGVASFDRLTTGQRQLTILEMTQALLDPNVEPPVMTAARAATVDVIYGYLQSLVAFEVEKNQRTTLRSFLLDAMNEVSYWDNAHDDAEPEFEADSPPAANDRDLDVWDEFVDVLCSTVLVDFDFSMENDFLDLPPVAAAELKRNLNIDPDYFVAVPDDPTPERLATIRKELHAMLR